MPFKKGHKAWNKGKKGYINKGSFRKGQKSWNKGRFCQIKRCKKCGCFVKRKIHNCRNVDLKGKRYCVRCKRILQNTNWERYSKVCARCGKKIRREKERILRKYLIKLFGGRCEICKYNKCLECLEFHHKNRKDKKGRYFLKQIIKYPKKFRLLCNRCHREIEMCWMPGNQIV